MALKLDAKPKDERSKTVSTCDRRGSEVGGGENEGKPFFKSIGLIKIGCASSAWHPFFPLSVNKHLAIRQSQSMVLIVPQHLA